MAALGIKRFGPVNSASAFAEALQQHRHSRGLTQAELAEHAHLSERAISDLERGLKKPQRVTVRLLTEALGLLPDQAREFEVAARRGPPGASSASGAPATQRESNLPVQHRSLIGRNRDTAGVFGALLGQEGCLVTLVGPGGVGKTRLALEVADKLLGSRTHPGAVLADGVWFVDLSAVTEADLVAPAVATALGIRVELDSGPDSTLIGYLAQRQLLLVVDNCEHVVERCADLLWTLRQRCPRVRVLATSREPLGIEGEVVWRLRPLEDDDAAQLFVERARAQHGTVRIEDGAAVLQLCRRLDGLPLAIELAAARVGVLTPSEMLAHLEDRFTLLRRTTRGAATRHQTLRATVDWSYELLDAAEQQLFRRLAVFASGLDLVAANAMGGQTTLDVLGRLIDKSLVLAEPGPHSTRYRLPETLRQYAWERLQEAGDVDFASARHLTHFLDRAEALYTPTQGLGGPVRALDVELDNLRSAFDWCELTDPAAGLRLVSATGYIWWRRSSAEGRRWADLFLQRCPEPTRARAGALHAAGMLELFSDPARALRREEEAYRIAEQLEDKATAAVARAGAGYAAVLQENSIEAIPQLEHSLALVESVGDPRGIAWVLIILSAALITDHARREEGRQNVERALSMAVAPAKDSDQAMPSFGHFLLGLYWRWSGAPARALEHFRRALELQGELELVPNLSSVLLQVARLLASSEPVRSARLAGAGLAFAERAGIRFPPRYRRAADQLQEELRRRLGARRAQRARAEGGQLSTSEAVVVALAGSIRHR
jgi:predicted ATPase/transcriptional regulator with XRE-family HTH domain